jgi:phage tail-like protein
LKSSSLKQYAKKSNAMNRDEFKFLVLNTPSLWQEGEIKTDDQGKESIEIAQEGLSLRKFYIHVLTESYPLRQLVPVDFALDSCGLIYILDSADNRLAILDTNTGTYQWIKCIRFSDPKALEVDASNVYVADGCDVCCLAKANYQIRWKASIENGNLIDMALDSKQNLYVLDTDNQLVFKIDKTGELSQVVLNSELKMPVSIVIDGEDNLYILEYEEKQILKFNAEGIFQSVTSPLDVEAFQPSALAVNGQNIYIGDKAPAGTPYQIDSTGEATPIGYEGATYRLILNKKGDLYLLGKNEIAFLKLFKRYISKGVYTTKPLDSNASDCQWHKVVIEADIPSNTRMSVSYYISNDETLPTEPSWSDPMINLQDALILSLRGKYIWFKVELVSDDLHLYSPEVKSLKAYFPRLSYLRYLPATYQEDETSREFLERFLSLFETFFSNIDETITTVTRYVDSKATPRAFLPWLSSWLAVVYDETWKEEKVRRLIERAPELYKKRGTRNGIAEIIELYTGEKPIIVENFQLRCLPDKAVDSKLVQKAKRGWSRLFLKDSSGFNAEDVIRIGNGTQEEFAVINYKDNNALILRGKLTSNYDIGTAVRKARIEEVLYGNCPYRFCVLLKPTQVKTADELNAVRRIIEREKPAHTVGGVRTLQPWLYLDMHTYLGINTTLTEPVYVLGVSSAISRDSVLSDLEESSQIDLRSRLGIDTKLT